MSQLKESNMNSEVVHHVDRYINPLEGPGHIGKDLRKISKNILEMFPHLLPMSKICGACRKKCSGNSSLNRTLSINSEEENSEVNSFESPNKKSRSSRQEELEEMLVGLKEKFSSLTNNDPLRVSILTIALDCWSLRQVATEFDTSVRMAKAARNLKKSEGILAIPLPKKGKTLPEETVNQVIDFYNNDLNSRIMPHKNEAVSVIIEGKKQKMQKRLLLCDVVDLHKQFKEKNPTFRISLSKFAQLRPKWCVFAGSSGTHSVCVCTIHQNFKTMLDAARLAEFCKDTKNPIKDHNDCIKFVLCRNPQPNCYLNVFLVLKLRNFLITLYKFWRVEILKK